MTTEQTQTKPKAKLRRPRGKYTKAFSFTPSMLISTATVDIGRRRQNSILSDRKKRGEDDGEPFRRYAWHPGDVRHAKTASDVLRSALKRAQAHKTIHTQKNRILLYGDVALLKAALRLAEHREPADEAQ